MNLIENMMYEQRSLNKKKKIKKIEDINNNSKVPFKKGDVIIAKDEYIADYETPEDTIGIVTDYNPNNDYLGVGVLHPEEYALPPVLSARGEYYRLLTDDERKKFNIQEDTVKKSNGKWTNHGDDGTEHGEFETKKQADAQRKAMYASGWKGESLKESTELDESLPADKVKDYQEWVDYDMKHYGKISDQTMKEIKEAGFTVVKDKYGDYEVVVHEESLKEDIVSEDTEELNNILYKEAFDLLKQAYKKFTAYYKRTKDPDTVMVARYLKKLIDGDKGDIDKIVNDFNKKESLDWNGNGLDDDRDILNDEWDDDSFYEDIEFDENSSGYQIASKLAQHAIEENPYEVFDTYGHFGNKGEEFDEVVSDLESQLDNPESQKALLDKYNEIK